MLEPNENMMERGAAHEGGVRWRAPTGGTFPWIAEPEDPSLDLVAWMQTHADGVRGRLRTSGAALFRGFRGIDIRPFEDLVEALGGPLLDYTNASTPRQRVDGRVYTSTEYPAHRRIPLHNEMSYSAQWPALLGFFCVHPAAEGGETPLADSGAVLKRLEPELVRAFEARDLLYVRNYDGVLDLPWQAAFGVDERAAVEAHCAALGITCEWVAGDHLRTRHRRPAVAKHPDTGEKLWFNQAHLFHVSSLPPEVRDYLLARGEEKLPRNVYFGDGAPIDAASIAAVRAAYDAETRAFPWHAGDLLFVDNMRLAHGRGTFSGARRVLVGMAGAIQG